MNHAFRLFGLLTVVLGVAIACSWQTAACAAEPDESGQRAELEFFEKRVRPLLHERCLDCHSHSAGSVESELSLDGRDDLLRGGNRGPAVVPGQPEASLLIEAVRYTNVDLQMPPEGKLSDQEIEILVEWVRRGAVAPAASVSAAERPGIDWETARRFWAFQPLRAVDVPTVQQGEWVRRRIDHFVLARLEQAQLSPRPEADRRQLIRRVTFDLIGLPPSPEEVEAFVNNPAPDAYERLVERLLSRPEYGERWARFWLDLARYTDETPDWLLSAERAWLYRDWVIRALNDDMPYDRFVKLQIAADFLEDARPEDIAALGFLGLNPTHWKELQLAPALIEQVVAEEWDEQIDAFSRTFLGLTVSCARCHDHKFDPISMHDYYALAGVFASIQQTDRPLLPRDMAERAMAARDELRALEEELKKLGEDKKAEADALREKIDALRAAHPELAEPWAHAVIEAAVFVLPDGEDHTKVEYRPGVVQDLPIFLRGNPSNHGPVVPRRYLQVFSSETPPPFTEGSGRRELAEALFAESGALAARVMVNRVWHQHFGSGIVRTPSDFGTQGDPPTHPELLEDLASRFVREGWSLKWLHRELVLSATYRQSSAIDPAGQQLDPDNRLLWRMHRKRLDVECWRDAMLTASGHLERRMYGPSQDLNDPAHRRRTLYGRIGRHEMNMVLRLFDVPEPSAHSPARQLTTTPLQQLFVLNGPLMDQQSRALAERIFAELPEGPREQRVHYCHELLFARPASALELQLAGEFLDRFENEVQLDPMQAWRHYIHALLGSNEMMFLD